MLQQRNHFYNNLANTLSKHEVVDLMAFGDALQFQCIDEDGFKKIVSEFSKFLSFDQVFCTHRDLKNGSTCDLVYCFSAGHDNRSWKSKRLKQFKSNTNNYYRNVSAKCWQDVDSQYTPDRGCIVKAWAEASGFKKSMTYCIRDAQKMTGTSFTFTGQHLTEDERSIALIKYAVPHFAETFKRIRKKRNNTVLTSKEIEVIQWLKKGKSSWDISRIMARSESVVNFHVRNIVKKLNAVNRTHAVSIAIGNKWV
ncbi:MAG: hypothetical protein KAH06_07725 [Desulfobacterales bacterium]|nr:hypothetical protein [Desulfobacterales bacterium]